MKTNKLQKRLHNLMYKHSLPYYEKFQNLETTLLNDKNDENFQSYSNHYKTEINDKVEIFSIAKSFNLSTEELHKLWKEKQNENKENKLEYNKKPTIERKDNKDTINRGNGRGFFSDIRYPRKTKKNAWKKFLKLFPHIKK